MIGELYPGEFEAMEHNGRMDAIDFERMKPCETMPFETCKSCKYMKCTWSDPFSGEDDTYDKGYQDGYESIGTDYKQAWDKAKKEIADLKTSHMIHFVDAINVPDVVIEIIDKHLSEVEEQKE